MAQTCADAVTDSGVQMQQSLWRRILSAWEKDNGLPASPATYKGHGPDQPDEANKPGLMRRVSRKVVPGLPRAQTFKRQRSEMRSKLQPVQPTPAERRAVSMDRPPVHASSNARNHSDPRTSAPDFLHHSVSSASPSPPWSPMSPVTGMPEDSSVGDLDRFGFDRDSVDGYHADAASRVDVQSMTTSQYDALIDSELERIWILNLSMQFRDGSQREKFFVTYREHEHLWRRVTISLDYRGAPEGSLESELLEAKYQRDKSAKIYEAIRESLPEIQFYDTVTNLKLETKDGRLHVHVVQDVNEIISYPSVRAIQHLNCRRVKEREIHFDSHMSGFVYKVRVHGGLLVKKEIPSPETVDEFLYEINALHQLCYAKNVIQFHGVVVDDSDEHVTGLLIGYAGGGTLVDVIYDNHHLLPWPVREKWARQIVSGLSELHEGGFVQGDFTLSNIVIDENEDAKIIDINRRGCPIGWEPPETTPLVDNSQRISLYIGVKSDLYQLGMVLWALATQEDEPDAHGRPLKLDQDVQVPAWYRRVVETCLSPQPQNRVHAFQLLSWFPDVDDDSHGRPTEPSISADDDRAPDGYATNGIPRIRTVHPPSDWAYVGWVNNHAPDDPYYYPSRGRSPPSPMPSNRGDYDSSRYGRRAYTWSDTYNPGLTAPSARGVPHGAFEKDLDAVLQGKQSRESMEEYSNRPEAPTGAALGASRDDESSAEDGPASVSAEKDQATNAGQLGTGSASPAQIGSDKRRHSPGTHDDVSSPEQATRGKTGPESQADSGKDVTEVASSAPRDHGPGSAESEPRRSLSSGKARSSPTESAAWSHDQRSTAEGSPGVCRGGDDPDSGVIGGNGHEQRRALHRVPSAELKWQPGGFAQPDDLKGIGSAYNTGVDGGHDDSDERRRQRPGTVLEDDLGLELDGALCCGPEPGSSCPR